METLIGLVGLYVIAMVGDWIANLWRKSDPWEG